MILIRSSIQQRWCSSREILIESCVRLVSRSTDMSCQVDTNTGSVRLVLSANISTCRRNHSYCYGQVAYFVIWCLCAVYMLCVVGMNWASECGRDLKVTVFTHAFTLTGHTYRVPWGHLWLSTTFSWVDSISKRTCHHSHGNLEHCPAWLSAWGNCKGFDLQGSAQNFDRYPQSLDS